MSDDSYVFEGPADEPPPPARDNNPPQTVSELSFALKRTLEDRFGHVRLRGEISKVNHHASGHVYLTLKDDKAAIDGVIWKGSVRGLGVQPQAQLGAPPDHILGADRPFLRHQVINLGLA